MLLDKNIGKKIPRTMQTINRSIAMIPLARSEAFRFRIKNPSPIAANIKRHEVDATEALVVILKPALSKPSKVPATMSANAAAISMENSQTKIKNKRLPVFPT